VTQTGAKKREEEEERRRQLQNQAHAGSAYTITSAEHFEYRSGDVSGLPWGGYRLSSLYSNVRSDTTKYSTSSRQGAGWDSELPSSDTYAQDTEMKTEHTDDDENDEEGAEDEDEDEDENEKRKEKSSGQRSASKSSGKDGKTRKEKR